MAILVVLVAGCASSSKANSAGGGGATYTIGVLSDATGLASSGDKYTLRGAEAGAQAFSSEAGIHLKFVSADTQSSPTGALNAAKTLVEQDHVKAVVAVSALAFAATSFLTQRGIPVVGLSLDGNEWITSPNMFSAMGFINQDTVPANYGNLFKLLGITNVGSIGYGISPSSSKATKNAAVSAQAAGVKVGYLNANFPFGTTNVQPAALAMKAAGVNGFIATVDANTGFALVAAMEGIGAKAKAVLPTGYGGDLLQAGPGALQNAQGVYFYTAFEPVEMKTPATTKFQSALKSVGLTTEPTYGDYAGYVSVALLVQGFKIAGAKPSDAALIAALSKVTNFDAGGLSGSHTIDMGNRVASAAGFQGCLYLTKLEGSTFQLVPGGDPVCGDVLPGKSG